MTRRRLVALPILNLRPWLRVARQVPSGPTISCHAYFFKVSVSGTDRELGKGTLSLQGLQGLQGCKGKRLGHLRRECSDSGRDATLPERVFFWG